MDWEHNYAMIMARMMGMVGLGRSVFVVGEVVPPYYGRGIVVMIEQVIPAGSVKI